MFKVYNEYKQYSEVWILSLLRLENGYWAG